MSDLPSAAEVAAWVSLVFAAAGTALAVRKKQSGTSLEVRENDSRGDWLGRIERERDDALLRAAAADARERDAREVIASLRMQIAVLTERTEKQGRQLDRVTSLLIQARPDFGPLLNSTFGDIGPDLQRNLKDAP